MPAESDESQEFEDTEFRGPQYQGPDSPEQRRSPSNRADPVSIGAGLVFFLVGGAYLLASGGHLTVNAGWTLSMLALGLGLSGILGAVLRARRGGGDRRD